MTTKNKKAEVKNNSIETAQTTNVIDLTKIDLNNIKISKSNKGNKNLYRLTNDTNFISESMQQKIKKEFNTDNIETLEYSIVNKVFDQKQFRNKVRKVKNSFLKDINMNEENNILSFLKFYKTIFICNDFSINSFSQSENAEKYKNLLDTAKDYLTKNNFTL